MNAADARNLSNQSATLANEKSRQFLIDKIFPAIRASAEAGNYKLSLNDQPRSWKLLGVDKSVVFGILEASGFRVEVIDDQMQGMFVSIYWNDPKL